MESKEILKATVTAAAQKLGYDHLKDKQMKEFVGGKYSFSLIVGNLA